ncbi:hypothetical protein CTA2_10079 [Colletotrichum tanaceti]|uniref:Uncharacterized protein n=1 Tax=Colletotrichum tanaceti TaxID=1306861 RepID=A0A4U6X6Z2_9PEZI|nr:hypothetical protein CTA2_10079 [Colletotrichum tanaceti]TKW51085.1 hypothetical protein CTA1_6154 [Colletotrichum tanaceti]
MHGLRFLLLAGTALWGSACGLALTFDAHHDELNAKRRHDHYRTPDCQDLGEKLYRPGYTYLRLVGERLMPQVDANGKKRECIWRGTGPNCNGAGEEGEVVLFKSGPSVEQGTSTYFTCPSPGWDRMMAECRWTEW